MKLERRASGSRTTLQRRAAAPAGGVREARACAADCSRRRRRDAPAVAAAAAPASAAARAPTRKTKAAGRASPAEYQAVGTALLDLRRLRFVKAAAKSVDVVAPASRSGASASVIAGSSTPIRSVASGKVHQPVIGSQPAYAGASDTTRAAAGAAAYKTGATARGLGLLL